LGCPCCGGGVSFRPVARPADPRTPRKIPLQAGDYLMCVLQPPLEVLETLASSIVKTKMVNSCGFYFLPAAKMRIFGDFTPKSVFQKVR
jgi:hypothetical protein